MAGLLRDSEHEDNDAQMGLMAETEASGLHLETMESAVSEDTQPHKVGHSEILCQQMGIWESLLESSRKPGANTLNNKRETRTSRIL